jgi:purine-binding chemotaxis protein CheW
MSEEKINPTEKQVLTFKLEGELYGVDILRIQEIKDVEAYTPIPNTPDWALGVINLRGSVVPVFDLRRMFFGTIDKAGVIIVLRVEHNAKTKVVGVVVDAVSNTEFAEMSSLQPAPKNGPSDRDFVDGLVSIDGKMVILVDVDKIRFFEGM